MIDVQNLSLSFGDRQLLKGISFQLGDSEKICLAGPNGSGKTTLLRILCGEMRPDGGAIVRSRSVKIGYLRQHLGEDHGLTVYQSALQAYEEALRSHDELEALRASLGDRHPTDQELDRMDRLQDDLIRSGYYVMESETRTVLAGLGFSPERQDMPLSAFSGGWRMRVALAKVLLSQPTCLFLDEPTNHLDLESIMWLEDYIKNYSGSLVLISHDRAFVDSTCDRILEIQSGNMAYYSLPYSKYEEEKAVRHDQILREYKKQQDEIESLERFVERFKAKASKATQAQSKQRQLDKIDRIELPTTAATMRLRFPEASPTGQWVFETEGLAKAYGDKTVFRDGKFAIQARDKVVLVGPNGAGKTTLLKLILGLEDPTAGAITRGANVQTAYFAQYEEPTPVECEMDLVAYVAEAHPRIGTQQIRSVLGSMLFSADDAFKKFGVLSGGERARVRLARMLLRDCNVLILDEPTNHLDMDSKNLLMQAIADFGGTVLFVSHDRHFVEKVATRVLLVKDGKVTDYPGDYQYYLHKLHDDEPPLHANPAPAPKADKPKGDGQRNQNRAGKTNKERAAAAAAAMGTFPVTHPSEPAGGQAGWEAKKEAERQRRKAQKRWTEIEGEIAVLDSRLHAVDQALCDPEI
ncbi:MAG TPA: ABC-F family ATP-binding cassette domain-containing protein, partial [Fibrobacteria bacterium]|nr:ABC-F family ATP-binding cassette domain-containing protein [Fibrobacteria bacterium]